ncbi:MAG: hypothetical protein GX362_06230 [Methanosarcinaceae archaeon]|nr:hypothetical protein [Methanosarcinaceae archaeon]
MSKDEMSHADRIKAAIDLKEPDRVPVFDSMNWSVNLAGNNINCIGKKEKDVSFPKWIHNADIFADSQIKAFEMFDHDFVHSRMSSHILAEPMGCKEVEPYWGVPATTEPAIRKVEDWKNLKFPNMHTDGKIPIQLTALRLLDKELHERRGEDVFITGFVRGPFTLAGIVLGVDRLMLAMIDKPDETKELIDFCADVTIECIKAQIDAGADHIYTPDPTASGDLISAKFFKEFAYPAAKKQSEAICSYKDKYAHHYHICGNTQDRWDMLEKIGASYVSLDYVIDIKKAKETIGQRQAIAGNLNPSDSLLFGTPDDVEKQGKEIIEAAAPGGGFIFWTGCDWAINCPLENVKRFFSLPKKYGTYPIN